MRGVFTCVVVVVLTFGALCATLRVPSEYATIQEAVNAAKSGDVILIAPGIYKGDITIKDKSEITLMGEVDFTPPAEVTCETPCYKATEEAITDVVLDGTLYIIDSDHISLERLTITGAGFGVFIRGRLTDPTDTVSIRYCNIVRNFRSGVKAVGTYQNLHIFCSNISYNHWDGIYLADWGSGIIIENSAINYNGRTTPRAVGIRVGGHVKELTIRCNVIQGNPFAGIHPG